jgi:hypothetical protein
MSTKREVIFTHHADDVTGTLEIDTAGRLYWNGEQIAVELLQLTFGQKLGAALTVGSAVVVAVVTVLQYVAPPNGSGG